jgi:hypothetical protein
LLLRSPGFHTGQNFLRIVTSEDLVAAATTLPGEVLLAIEYIDAATTDGLARKYRMMFIDRALYPFHLAISADWKVHYFSAAMKDRPDLCEEERSSLNNIRATLGARAYTALDDVQTCLDFD